MSAPTDTIAAIATGAGAGGIGIVRLSGPAARRIGETLAGIAAKPRRAHYVRFRAADGSVLDDGLLLWFPAPRSFTGEDVVELQAHGSPPLLRLLLARVLALGARLARPGEFTERAFLNGRLDLAQAEGLADLIEAGSEAAARAARRSLEGDFSRAVDAVLERLTGLRIYVEAAIDFPEEEIDFLASAELAGRLSDTRSALNQLLQRAEQGQRLRDGLHAVILGPPNAGKSSLLNALAGSERAIVTEQPGTTRDLLRETLRLDGIELTLVDTAGLRESGDAIEREGMRRAREESARADLVLLVLDDAAAADDGAATLALPGAPPQRLWIHNKIDRSGAAARIERREDGTHLWLSAATGAGLPALRHTLAALAGGQPAQGAFSARLRHVEALRRARGELEQAAAELAAGRGELAAEALRLAQDALGEITGRVTPDDLLGRIFSSFCIGK